MSREIRANVTCVAVGGRGLLIEGPPGSGKSSLALALIDRGAVLVGDDAIGLEERGERLWAVPPPEITGMLEIRGVGIVKVAACEAPLCLALTLGENVERVPEPKTIMIAGAELPSLPFKAGAIDAIRAEWALRLHGLPPA